MRDLKKDNPDIEGDIKLTGVDLPGLIRCSLGKPNAFPYLCPVSSTICSMWL